MNIETKVSCAKSQKKQIHRTANPYHPIEGFYHRNIKFLYLYSNIPLCVALKLANPSFE
jgi:hypothetical protein